MSNKVLKNVRINPITNEPDFFFPMEIMDPADKEYARLNGLEVGKAMLGYRTFEAIMIPCKRKTHDAQGREIYLDTPSEEQRRIYKAYSQDELDRQEEERMDGRCQLPSASGKGVKVCPRRIPNPDYVPGGDQPKTLPNRCEVCPYERFKQAHTTVELSCLDHENEAGEMEPFEVPAPRSNYAGDRYEELAEAFVAFVREKKPKLAALAELKVAELNLTEAAKELDKAISTVDSQTKKLEELLLEFLDNAIIF